MNTENKKIVLLNPPSSKLLQRDFICSASSKANYYWPPIDFVVLSGILKNHKLKLIDAIIDNLSPVEVLKKIQEEKPDFIISLVSAIDFENEVKILEKIKKENPQAKIIAIGDVAFFEKDGVIAKNCIDAILLKFVSHEILSYIQNPSNKKIKDLIYKINGRIVWNGFEKSKFFSYGQANFGIFDLNKYSIPYALHKPFAPILTNYGCPYQCEFCSSGKIGYYLRDIEETKKEIASFAKKGFKEMFIRDFNFTTNKQFVRELCDFIIDSKIKIAWSCEGRVDNVDEELLLKMKEAGCYLIFFGIESGNQKSLDLINKNTTIEQIIKVFSFCKKIKIKTLGSVIIAYPGETKEEILETINFVKEINADYISFNLYVPRYGSTLRARLEKDKKLKNDSKFDSSTEFINLTKISDEEITNLYKKAIKSFYFRPRYIFEQIMKMRTISQIKSHFLNGWSLLKKSLA